jgi:hypothetical protein
MNYLASIGILSTHSIALLLFLIALSTLGAMIAQRAGSIVRLVFWVDVVRRWRRGRRTTRAARGWSAGWQRPRRSTSSSWPPTSTGPRAARSGWRRPTSGFCT